MILASLLYFVDRKMHFIALALLEQTMYTYVKWICGFMGVEIQNMYYRPGKLFW